MIAAARQEVLGDDSPSEQLVREAQMSFEVEPDESLEALAKAVARERKALAAIPEHEFEPATRPAEPAPTLSRHETGTRPRRGQRQRQELPPDPFTRQPRVSRRLRRLIPLVIVAIVVINAFLDTDIGTELQNLWYELFGEGGGSVN